MTPEKKYRLPSGTQVRQEDFGLLFYTMKGPRLYFLPLKQWMEPSFFQGERTLNQWMAEQGIQHEVTDRYIEKINTCLEQLSNKGVILEC